jgi:thioredoxin reductase/Pyruvate/2-oxoacid:ferredoxin oxidoreductase delta subunit
MGTVVTVAAGLLAALLVALGAWQRRIDRRQRARVVSAIEEAKALGADRPIGQYPHIDPLRCIGCSSCVRACPEDNVIGMVMGVAHVVQAARCIGHGLCAEACPVGAIVVGLGDLSARPDVPQLTEDLESTVPGVFIAGELGGLALIRNAVEQGVRGIEAVARRIREERPPRADADVLIVGAGPAGLAASLKAVELGLSYVTIDQNDIGGTVRKYPRRKLVMTQPVELPLYGRVRKTEYVKEELIELWQGVLEQHGVKVRERVKFLGTRREDGRLVSETSQGPVSTRCVLLALGRRGTPRKLGVPGEDQEKVLYQLVDAATYNGLRCLVVGGGDSAIEAALGLAAQPGNDVTLSYRKPEFFRIKARNEERIRAAAAEGAVRLALGSEIRSVGEEHVDLTAEGRAARLPNDFVFVFAGGEPPYPLLKGMGVRFWGEVAA